MKWRAMSPHFGDFNTEVPDKMIKWAHKNGKTVRGHSLLWAKAANNPDWVQELYGEDFTSAIYERVENTIRHFEEYDVRQWDVINEMVNQGSENHEFYIKNSGDPDIRAKIFNFAKDLSPDTKLFINDYGIILNKYGRFKMFQEQIRELLAAGAPIDALGLQSHISGSDFVDVNAIKYHVDLLWEEFKMPIFVTEFDWNGDEHAYDPDHQVHAEQVEKFYRLMFR